MRGSGEEWKEVEALGARKAISEPCDFEMPVKRAHDEVLKIDKTHF